jgi:hypothetical protein
MRTMRLRTRLPSAGGLMTLRPQTIDPAPPEMACIAQAAFPKGRSYLRPADEPDMRFTGELFTILFPVYEQPALARWRR